MSLYTRDNARRSLIDTAAYRALSQVATVLGYVVMVRGMSQVDFGVFNLLYAFLPVVSTLASLGLDQVLRRYQPEYLRAGNTAASIWLVRVVGSTRFGVNLLILGAVLIFWDLVAPTFKLGPYRLQFALFCTLALLHFQALILQSALASHMLHRFSVGATAMLAFVKLLGYAAFAWFGTLTIEKAILTDTVGYAIAFGLLRLAYYRHTKTHRREPTFKPDTAERRRLIKYGIYNNFNDAGTLLLTSKTDTFFIAAFIDPISVGIYAFYNRLTEMVGNVLPVRLFENVVLPLFFSMSPSDAQKKIPQYFSLLLNLNLLLQWPVLAFVTAYHHEIVAVVFAGKFAEDSWLLPVVMAFATFNSVSIPVTMVAQYYEKASIILYSKVFAVYSVFALLLLVPRFGVYGAALASGSASVFKNMFIWWHVRDRAVWLNRRSALLSSLAIWSGAVLAACGLKAWVPTPDLVQLLMGGVLFVPLALLYIRSPAISASDRGILGSVLRGKESRLLGLFGLLPKPGRGAREP
jgi:O-antigen/teichoic acid export membrane protein